MHLYRTLYKHGNESMILSLIDLLQIPANPAVSIHLLGSVEGQQLSAQRLGNYNNPTRAIEAESLAELSGFIAAEVGAKRDNANSQVPPATEGTAKQLDPIEKVPAVNRDDTELNVRPVGTLFSRI